jgi:hypothetical protein
MHRIAHVGIRRAPAAPADGGGGHGGPGTSRRATAPVAAPRHPARAAS